MKIITIMKIMKIMKKKKNKNNKFNNFKFIIIYYFLILLSKINEYLKYYFINITK